MILSPPPAAALPPAPARVDVKSARSRVVIRQVRSERLGRTVAYSLLLPEGYDAAGTRRYPVLYLLHGTGDDHTSWNAKSGVAAHAAGLPLIVVMPDAGLTRYINTPGGGPYTDFFVKELVPHIDTGFRTIARRDGRALAGLSMGGFGAWRLGMAAPGTFAATASLSGSFAWGEIPFENERYRARAVALYGGDGPEQRAMWAADAVWPHVRKNVGADGRWQGPALFFVIGTGDHLLDANRLMRRRLEEAKVPFVYAEDYGGHEWPFWDRWVRDALAFTLRHVAAPE